MMSDKNPFANWPYLDAHKAPGASAPDSLPTPDASPGASPESDDLMASNNALENFLGGSPAAVFVKLLLVSLVVGALLMWLEIRPGDIFHGIVNFANRLYALGFGAVRELINYVLAGAAIVVPAWLILRLLGAGGRK